MKMYIGTSHFDPIICFQFANSIHFENDKKHTRLTWMEIQEPTRYSYSLE